MNGNNDNVRWRVFQGSFCHSTEKNVLEVRDNAIIGVIDRKIGFVGDISQLKDYQDRFGFETEDVKILNRGQFLIPGFIDTHIHSCQYSYAGTGLDLPLLEWLKKYTYPVESKFSDLQIAQPIHEKIVKRTLNSGTTTAQYFSSIHLNATLNLCDITQKYGQRAFVGKTCVDRSNIKYYEESTYNSADDTEKFIQNIQSRMDELLTPVVTPRFAVCCSADLMSRLGRLAEVYQVPIQSHISENLEEIKTVEKLFPNNKSYADVYRSFGLLNSRSVMAHGIHLSDSELEMVNANGASISHCPTSNYNLQSGQCNVKKLIDTGITVGLGTDIAGGHSYSILRVLREAYTTSVSLSYQQLENGRQEKHLSYPDLFSIATLGGAKSLNIDDVTGNFEVGKEFDALLINNLIRGSPIDIFPEDDTMSMLSKFLTNGDDRNIEEVYVAGRKISIDQ